jgi:hypothetical protein
MSDRERECDRNRGVDGISTGFKDSFAGIGGVGFASHDHAVSCMNGLAREKGRNGEKDYADAHIVLSHSNVLS